MVDQVESIHRLLPLVADGMWQDSMREVDAYLRTIDHYFRRDELKIEAEEFKLDSSELAGADDLETAGWFLKMNRIAHETKYNLFMKSSAAMIYSAFEVSLRSVAQIVSEVTGVERNVKKYEGKPAANMNILPRSIGNYALYLINVHHLDWVGLEKMWAQIDDFRFVRNRIVHETGELDVKDFKKFDEICADQCGLSRDEDAIIIELFYLSQVVDVMKEFLKALCSRLDARVFPK